MSNDIETQKYKLLLKLVNKLLVNMGKDKIEILTDFKDIDREEILSKKNEETLNKMISEFYPLFDKRKSGYYSNKKSKFKVVNILRGLTKETNYEFKYKNKEVYIEGDFGRARKSKTYYTFYKK